MQGRIATLELICVQNVSNVPVGTLALLHTDCQDEKGLNVPVGTLNTLDWRQGDVHWGRAKAHSVPIGTSSLMFQSEHNGRMFQLEHCAKCSGWNTSDARDPRIWLDRRWFSTLGKDRLSV
jgi:hypothetical protein